MLEPRWSRNLRFLASSVNFITADVIFRLQLETPPTLIIHRRFNLAIRICFSSAGRELVRFIRRKYPVTFQGAMGSAPETTEKAQFIGSYVHRDSVVKSDIS
jgi:hypothetical protein